MRNVVITREPVELYKILKFEGLAQNGGEAKAVIEQGLVKVNQVVETRKRKQIVAGDRIEYGRETLNIVLQGTQQKAATQATTPKTTTPNATAPKTMAPKKRRNDYRLFDRAYKR